MNPQWIQTSGERDRGHLEDAAGRPVALSEAERPGVVAGGLSRRHLREWSVRHGTSLGGFRLTSFWTPLDKTS